MSDRHQTKQNETKKTSPPVQRLEDNHQQMQQHSIPNMGGLLQRMHTAPHSLTPAHVLQLQRVVGNQAVGQVLDKSMNSEATGKAIQRKPMSIPWHPTQSAVSGPLVQPSREPAFAGFLQRMSGMGYQTNGVPPIQRDGLRVGPANDKYEKEADETADQIMRMPNQSSDVPKGLASRRSSQMTDEQVQMSPLLQRYSGYPTEETVQSKPLSHSITPLVQRHPSHADEEEVQPKRVEGTTISTIQRHPGHGEEEVQAKPLARSATAVVQRHPSHADEEEVQPKRVEGAKLNRLIPNKQVQRLGGEKGFAVRDSMSQQLSSMNGGGRPMPGSLQRNMENKFGADFSGVRFHTGAKSVQMSQDIGAKAFTHGQNIHFGAGQYRPNTASGQHLMAHELTHVVQQTPKVVQTKRDNICKQPISQVKNNRVQRGFLKFGKRVGQAVTGLAGGILGAGLGIPYYMGKEIYTGIKEKQGFWPTLGKTALAALYGAPLGLIRGAQEGAGIWNKWKEHQLSKKYGVKVGGITGGFSESMLEEVEKTFDSLPEGHVGGTYLKDGLGIKGDKGIGSLASFYGYGTEDEKATSSITVGSPWWLPSGTHKNMKIGEKTLGLLDSDEAALKMDALDIRDRYPDQGNLSIFRGIGDVHDGRQLVPYTIRHEMGHAIDHKIKFTKTRGRLKEFGGWITHGEQEGGANEIGIHDQKADTISEHFRGLVGGIEDKPLYHPETKDYSSIYARIDYDPDQLDNYQLIAGKNKIPIPNIDSLKQKFRNFQRLKTKASKSPWMLADGGGNELAYNGRVMHKDHYGSWVSYEKSERDDHGVSNYQFSSPGEWFAEAYAVYYDPDTESYGPRGRDRLNPTTKDWFKKNLGPGPGEEGDKGRLIGKDDKGRDDLKELADITPEMMSFLNDNKKILNSVLPEDLKGMTQFAKQGRSRTMSRP